METNAVDLRYSMKKVIKSLELNEPVTLYYRGKKKALIVPVEDNTKTDLKSLGFFGMHKNKKENVEQEMEKLRGGRYNDI